MLAELQRIYGDQAARAARLSGDCRHPPRSGSHGSADKADEGGGRSDDRDPGVPTLLTRSGVPVHIGTLPIVTNGTVPT